MSPTHYLTLISPNSVVVDHARCHQVLDGVVHVQKIRDIEVTITWHLCQVGDIAMYCSTNTLYGDVAIHEHTKRVMAGLGVKYLVTKALVRNECMLVDDATLPQQRDN